MSVEQDWSVTKVATNNTDFADHTTYHNLDLQTGNNNYCKFKSHNI